MICSDRHISDLTRFARFVQRNPFLRFTTAFVAGILIQYYSGWGIAVWSVPFCISFALVLSVCILYKRIRKYGDWIFVFSVFLFFISGGAILCARHCENIGYEWAQGQAAYDVQLLSKVKEKENTIHFKAVAETCHAGDTVSGVGRNVLLYIARDSVSERLREGDRIVVLAEMARPDKSELSSFDYARYLVLNGYSGCAYVAHGRWGSVGHEDIGGIVRVADRLRRQLLDIYVENGITGENFDILSSVVLGYRATMSEEVRSEFSRAGASHVLAVSGLHVGILYGIFLLFFGGILRTRIRYVAVPAAILLLWMYAFITGLAPSVCRAVMMFSLCLIGDMFRRQRSVYNTISISAFILLVHNPLLLFDVGFQLSYIAVLSIVTFVPVINSWFRYGSRLAYKSAQLLIVPIAANIAVMPVIIYYFHQFPLYFILSNVVISFLAPLMIYASFLLFVFSPLPYIATAISCALRFIMDIFRESVSYIADMPFSSSVAWIGFGQLLLLLSAVVILVWLVNGFTLRKFVIGGAMINLCLLLLCADMGGRHNGSYMIVADNAALTVNLVCGDRNTVYTSDSLSSVYAMSDIWLKYDAPEPEYVSVRDSEYHTFTHDGRRCMILRGNPFRNRYNTGDMLKVDCLIVGRGVYPAEKLFGSLFDVGTLVVAPDVWRGYYDQYGQLASEYGFDIHFVDTSGPYILSDSSVSL